MKLASPLTRFRIVLALFIAGLVVSGVTAFPLRAELGILADVLGVGNATSANGFSGLDRWILTVRFGLEDEYACYPWLAYGTDWLAFGHIVIAIFFIGPLLNPLANKWVLQAGLIACAGVLPLALICGPLREIPFYWRLVDCSFGIFGALPLIYCLRLLPRIAAERASMH
ncbi:MAG TPA: hypothetical protein VG733_17345 [Chthoniobacteraceae bacterium]|nr:hypothetical protein [Chthoniobacteraceae bacterium]